MDVLVQDIRAALRSLGRARGYAILAVVCLAAGIGINTAIFSVVHAILFRPLPFVEPDRVVAIGAHNVTRGVTEGGLTFADLDELQVVTQAFETIEGQALRNYTLSVGEESERLEGAAVTPGLFAMLGVQPALGRGFRPDEAAPAGFEQVVLLSDALWRSRFNADPHVVGRPVRINRRELVVIGVMPAGFAFPDRQRLWLPLGATHAQDRSARFIGAVGRLRPGVTLEQADARVQQAAADFARQYPATHAQWGLRAQSYRDAVSDPGLRRLMMLMFGAVSFVLLIACANVANLTLARAADRGREMSVRVALGASRRRIFRHVLTESVLLAMIAGTFGVLAAAWLLRAILATIPEEPTYWMRIGIQPDVLLYTGIIAVATGVLFGMLPAWHAARANFFSFMRDGGRGGDGRGLRRVRSGLVVAEISLSLVLVVGALLFMRSFLNVQRANIGFDIDPLLSMRVMLTGDQYDSIPTRILFYNEAADRIAALPGVSAAAVTSAIPADDGGLHLRVLTSADRDERDALVVSVMGAGAGLFDALGASLHAGREFTAAEAVDTSATVAIVGRTLAERLWPGESAIGRSLRLVEHERTYTIVGVAPDIMYEEFGEETAQSRVQLHLPFGRFGWRGAALMVRAGDDPAALVQPVRAVLQQLDPGLAPYEILTMRERRALTSWNYRLFGQLFAIFGAMALILALSGVYGVMAYSVARRRREISVRVALGAAPGNVRGMIVRDAAVLTSAGVALGLIGAFAISRLAHSTLYGVSAVDPLTFTLVPLLFIAVAFAASVIPARRAARVDPMLVLRSE